MHPSVSRLALLSLLTSTHALAQTPATADPNPRHEVEFQVDLLCSPGLHRMDQRREDVCSAMHELAVARKKAPLEIKEDDDEGHEWTIKFNFGNANTQYDPTDIHFQNHTANVIIRNFRMQQRTNSSSFDPNTYKEMEDWLRWIDEPTNTFDLTFEKDKNVFMISAFHPKFLFPVNAVGQVDGTVNGHPVSQYGLLNQPNFADQNQMHLLQIQNTYGQMDFSAGYGRKFYIYRSQNGRHALTWMPHVGVGLTTGATQGLWQNADGTFFNTQNGVAVQGFNATAGHMIQYSFGKFNAFAGQRYTYASLHSTVLGGTADMKMSYQYVTFGLGIQLWNRSRKGRP